MSAEETARHWYHEWETMRDRAHTAEAKLQAVEALCTEYDRLDAGWVPSINLRAAIKADP